MFNIFKEKAYSYTDIIISLMLLLIADNVMIMYFLGYKIALLIFLIIVAINRNIKFDLELYYVLFFVTMIILIQGLRWEFYYSSLIGFYGIVVLLPYLAAKIVGVKFLEIASDIVYYSAIISIVLFLGQILVPGFTGILMKLEILLHPFNSCPDRPSILIYSIATNTVDEGSMSSFLRNPGMFHEPGAFATFIDLAITINIFKGQKPFSKRNLVLLFALITTFSTAGILGIILIYLYYYYITNKQRILNYFAVLLFLLPIIVYVFQLPFMTAKIQKQFNDGTQSSITSSTSGRIMGARKSIIVLSRYPLFGRGLSKGSKETNYSSDEKAGYGFMDYFSTLGIIASVLFIRYFIKAIKRISFHLSGKNELWPILALGLLFNLFSQKFIGDQFFTMFLFIGLLKQFSFENITKFRNHASNQ